MKKLRPFGLLLALSMIMTDCANLELNNDAYRDKAKMDLLSRSEGISLIVDGNNSAVFSQR